MFLPYEDLPKTGVRLGVMFEPRKTGGGLTGQRRRPRLQCRTCRSQAGDVIVAMDGEALVDTLDLTYAVKKKHAGDHGKLKVERQGRPLEVDVLFDPEVPARPEKEKQAE